MAGLFDASTAAVEQIDAVERMQSGPQRAAADRKVGARPAPSNHAERILVAVCAQIGTRDRHSAGRRWRSWGRHESARPLLRWPTRVDLLQHERKATVPGRPARQHRERQRTAAAGPARHTVDRWRAEESRRAQPRRRRRVGKWIAQRVRQRDRHPAQAQIVGREDLELVTLGDGDCLDRDQLRTGGTDETTERNGETNGPQATG